MTLLEKILLEKSKENTKPTAISAIEITESIAMGIPSPTPLRRAKKGKMPNHANILKMERYFGYSIEELIAEAK